MPHFMEADGPANDRQDSFMRCRTPLSASTGERSSLTFEERQQGHRSTIMAAALYGACESLRDVKDEAVVLVDGGKPLALASNCVWDDDALMCDLARASRLRPLYGHFPDAERNFLRIGVEAKLGKARDFLAMLHSIRTTQADGDLFALAAECYRRLAQNCVSSAADRGAVANAFCRAGKG